MVSVYWGVVLALCYLMFVVYYFIREILKSNKANIIDYGVVTIIKTNKKNIIVNKNGDDYEFSFDNNVKIEDKLFISYLNNVISSSNFNNNYVIKI